MLEALKGFYLYIDMYVYNSLQSYKIHNTFEK